MSKPLRLLFCNPPSPDGQIYIRDINRSGRLSKERTLWPQTSLAMLAAVFPDHNVRIVDCIAENISYAGIFKILKEFKPEWVVFNPVSTTFSHDMIIAHYAKSLGAKTVITSPHSKALKEETHERFPSLDFALDYQKLGVELEYSLRELITGEPSVGTRFEDIPSARQDLLPIHRYNLPFIGRGYTFVVTSRGCPWKCIYCRQTVVNESVTRFRPVQTVIEEIKRYKLKNIALHADTSTCNKQWMMKFCAAMPKGVRWICNSRVDTVDQEMLRAMKEAGCWMICYGIESGNNKVLEMNRKEATVEQAVNAVKWAKNEGIKVWGYFMLGMYGDTPVTMAQTVDLACSLPLDIANFSISAPYPGTEWYDISKTNEWIMNEDWESFDQNYSAQVSQPGCPPGVIKKIQKKAYLRWYVSTRGLKFLWNCLKTGDISYFVKTALNHIK